MKKIMIAAAVMFVTVVANAASYTWSGTWSAKSIYGPDGTTSSISDITAYVYCSALGSDPIASATVSPKSIMGGAGSVGNPAINASVEYNTTYSFYLELVANYNGTSYTLTTKDTPVTATSPTLQQVTDGDIVELSVDFGNLETLTQNKTNWTTTGNVPEPTSGLLLLCGLAGLALRRKRA